MRLGGGAKDTERERLAKVTDMEQRVRKAMVGWQRGIVEAGEGRKVHWWEYPLPALGITIDKISVFLSETTILQLSHRQPYNAKSNLEKRTPCQNEKIQNTHIAITARKPFTQ